MSYNFSNINGSNVITLSNTVNDTFMYGQMGNLWLIMFFVITLSTFLVKTNDPKRSFSASSLITFILATFLRTINLVNDVAFYLTLVMAAIATFLLFLSKD